MPAALQDEVQRFLGEPDLAVELGVAVDRRSNGRAVPEGYSGSSASNYFFSEPDGKSFQARRNRASESAAPNCSRACRRP